MPDEPQAYHQIFRRVLLQHGPSVGLLCFVDWADALLKCQLAGRGMQNV